MSSDIFKKYMHNFLLYNFFFSLFILKLLDNQRNYVYYSSEVLVKYNFTDAKRFLDENNM